MADYSIYIFINNDSNNIANIIFNKNKIIYYYINNIT